MKRIVFIFSAALLMVACTEKPQTIGSRVDYDEAAHAGSKYPHAVPGWTAGDKKTWQEQLRVRTQRGQNEYSRL